MRLLLLLRPPRLALLLLLQLATVVVLLPLPLPLALLLVLVGVLVDLCQGPLQVQLPPPQRPLHRLSSPSCRLHCWAQLPLLLHTHRLRP